MRIDRRDFLKAGAAASAAMLLPATARANSAFAPKPGNWRRFEVVTRLEIAEPQGRTQAWIPLPSVNEADWFRSENSEWTTNAGRAQLAREPKYGADMLHVEWEDGEKAPVVEVVSRIATRDRAVDLSAPGSPPPLTPTEQALYTAGTDLIPVDGIVLETAQKITAGANTDLDRARAIYDWVVDNTFRDASVRGCGIGDIAAMLESGNLGGKCADLNALYVGLARAAGLPARDVYGIRVAPSQFGYASLGAKNEVITKAQHCRAEVYLDGHGWVPVDPADVRKVVLEEPPGNLAADDAKVVAAREALFGAWETNWLAYNMAHDVSLPGAAGPKLGFLMYPQAETASLRLDCLDPDRFRYAITARELMA
ncbi:transglutaminase-like putative cysteine protease [Aquamicrobium terrae]|uniref:Transglutaminase-like putative cysteine protease n=1 Tax=Aquamicrobium terrae TaxID=1324945 RepID=A0ABV2N5L8_9HYPH